MDNLERLDGLLGEITSMADKLKLFAKDPEATVQTALAQMSDVVSLLGDVAASAFSAVVEVREYLHDEVEPLITAGGAADPDDPSQLMPDDAELFGSLITTLRASLMAGIELMGQNPDLSDEDKAQHRTEIQGQLNTIENALARIEEIRLEPPGDDDEGDDDDDDDDEPASDVVASTEPAPPEPVPAPVVALSPPTDPKPEDEAT